MKKIVIVGGGMLGLGTAWRLAQDENTKVTIIEKEKNLGGMSSYSEIGTEVWDKYYHVILSSDKKTLGVINDLGLEKELFWRDTKSGFYGKGKLVSMTSVLDFLRFPFLNLWDKFRLGVGIIYSSRINNSDKLEKVYLKIWMTKVFGRRVYERIWDPLLRSKLGPGKEKTSAAFIWATIKRLYGARQDSSEKVERMGHLHGGYRTIIEAWEKKLIETGVKIHKEEEVLSLDLESSKLVTNKASYEYDQILFTCSSKTVLDVIPSTGEENHYWDLLKGQEYLGVRCGVLLLKNSLSPYYVINLLDEDLPFTGIIESTNVIGTEELNGNHLIYLPQYSPEEKVNKDNDDELLESFIASLKRVFPKFNEDDVLASHVVSERFVQPLYVLNYGNRIPDFKTPHENVWLANTSMVTNATLNNNASLELAEKVVREMMEE